MPSVGMRRTTRVFGVVKGTDGARVLRSGRRLRPEPGVVKLRRDDEGEGWFKLVKTTEKGDGGVGTRKVGCPLSSVKTKPGIAVTEIDEDNIGIESRKPLKGTVPLNDGNGRDSKYGIVYKRKREKLGSGDVGFEDRMFGLQFSRRQRRKKGGELVDGSRGVLAIVVESSYARSNWSYGLLFTVLRHAVRARLRLTELSAFFLSDSMKGVFASQGIRFLSDHLPITSIGIFKFFGTTQFAPSFYVDFAAVPLCFQHIHYRMVLRSTFMSFVLVNTSLYVHRDDKNGVDSKEGYNDWEIADFPSEGVCAGSEIVASDVNDNNNRNLTHPLVKLSKLPSRNTQYRNLLNSRGIQKRRSSLRRRKSRNPLIMGINRPHGAMVSDIMDNSKKRNLSLSSVVSSKKLRSSVQKFSSRNTNEASSTMMASLEDMDSSFCSANLLVVEPDKCYRVEGVIVMLEISDSGEWFLVVKKDGSMRSSLKVEKIMRPFSCNRFTHVIMWALDNGWKLEFPNRQNWLIFKDLYKECSDRNVPAPIPKSIPIPGVHEVLDYDDSNIATFSRPDAYICMQGDELSRAMTKRTANYDMDSEDDEWLKKFNDDFQEHLSQDNFELMIDAFEKAVYCSPDDFSDEKAAIHLCADLGRREVVESVFTYWMKKRKQKRSSLIRVFQGHQLKKAPLIPKPFLRKRRSFKRQPSQIGRGKQPRELQAIAAEQDALEERNAMVRVEEAKASAYRSAEAAIVKRKKAQLLLEHADLAAYRATMLLRIAEAAKVAESTDTSVGCFLD